MSFIKELKKAITTKQDYQLWIDSNTKADDPLTANSISISNQKWKLLDQSGYGKYDCWTVLYFYTNKDLDHPSYLQKCSSLEGNEREVGSISFLDRRDLLDYLTGISETSSKLTGKADPVQEKTSQDANLYGFDLPKKRSELPDEIRGDYEAVKRVKSLERTVNSISNVLSIRGPKNFSNLEKPAFTSFIEMTKDPQKFSRQLEKNAHAAVTKKNESKEKSLKIPIIIVPAASQSLLTLYNVKEFLVDGTFVSSDEMRRKIDKKPLQVSITRDPKKLSAASQPKFLILDSIDTLKPDDWARVVAVFATGQEWQFKRWKWSKPVDIFSNVMGFSLKFQDDPPAGLVTQWNVQQLQINRTKRYLDSMVVHKFWQSLDQFITMNRAKVFTQ